MLYLEVAILLGSIALAAKLGGIGVGIAGGFGLTIVVFALGLTPGEIPITVMLIIMAIILALSVVQKAGGIDYMVKLAGIALRKHPKYIDFLAPLIAFILTVITGTGYSSLSIFNIIQEVAKQNGVRPSQPLSSAVVASQLGITASPISAATATTFVYVEQMGVSFSSMLCVIVPAALFGVLIAALVSSFQGCELKDDPIYIERLKQGLVNLGGKQMDEEQTKGAKISVWLFLGGVAFIVGMLLFKKQIGHSLATRDLIIISMYFISALIIYFSKINLSSIKETPIFKDGAQSLIVVLGIVWLSATILGAHTEEIKTFSSTILKEYPGFLAVIFFIASSMLFSQGATAALLVPLAVQLNVDAQTILASLVAASALYITNIYPTTAFAIAIDDTGSYMDKKWNGSFIVNHPFFLPGLLGICAAVPFGFLLAKIFV